MGTRHEQKAYSRVLVNHVHNHVLKQFYLGRQGATDFHPKPRKRIGLTSLYFKLGGLVDRGAPRGRAGYLAAPGGDSMVFGSATLGVSVRSGASRTRQSLGRLDEQLERLLGRPRWPGFVAAPFWRAWPAMLGRSERVSCSFRVDAPLDPVHSSASPDRVRAVCPDLHAPPPAPTPDL